MSPPGVSMCSLAARRNYQTLQHCVYLNQASLGLLSERTVQAMHAFIDDVARHGNWNMSDDEEVAVFERVRASGAEVLGARPEALAVVGSASEILGQLALLADPPVDGRVVVVESDFPAVTRPWLRLEKGGGCQVRFVRDVPNRDLTATLIDAIDGRTCVVAVSQVQFATGTVVDVRRLRRAASEVGAMLIIDATQAAGAIPVEARAWEADAVVSSGYKWLGGHGGIALCALAPWLLERDPPLPGWMGADDPFSARATALTSAPGAARFTLSTMSYVSLIGLATALEEWRELGADAIETHADGLARLLHRRLEALGWSPFHSEGGALAASHIVSVAPQEPAMLDVAASLKESGVVCSNRNGRVRISLAPYNDESDVSALIEALRAV